MRAAGLRRLAQQGLLRRGDHGWAAEWIGIALRTLQADLAVQPEGPARRPGRPGHERRERWTALRLVGRVLRTERYAVGWRTVSDTLEGRVTVYLVQECTRSWKRRHRRQASAARAAARVSVEVTGPGVMWAIDAKHLSRSASGVVQAEVVKDTGSRGIAGGLVGPPATGEEVVALLDAAVEVRGGPPLVLSHDNGKAYVSRVVRGWRTRHGVLDLCNVPHVPQHNACVERGMRELGEQTGLGRGVRDVSVLDAARRVQDAALRLNARRRAVLGWKSADEVDRLGGPDYSPAERKELADEVHAAQEEAVRDARGARARRLAARRALLGVLERRGRVRITRGGSRSHARKGAGVS